MSYPKYGLCPAQLDGRGADGTPFYFRSRGGAWTLHKGNPGDPANYCGWSGKHLVASGAGDVEDGDAIDQLVTRHIGTGWSGPLYETYEACCTRCKKVFQSDATSMCMDCLIAVVLRFED
ncbi:Uncharacterised protein [Mycobacteroides abscessus subsp. abscessus]|uniref:Bacteriophage protein n=1 Tax=Mycobacteroides abscessus TaxID=36809 RepID=A0AB33T2L6_9MYCO|nr:hypothetical protein [Mycobacteroides abscessus]CPT12194.1 Uncharacterised protein [Mycobacteroides abscessus]CPT20831.1 Uncharacterised protein [Mycobacteroides abscessus]CPT25486.1 Uncharacterised protein [Mycobacteroides abscessus]CPU73513.1 Uncharacterised protein [Mycobacteroides abscessus]CPV25785.1 Uncharacterised protein [Mycobacteroides abscessus]